MDFFEWEERDESISLRVHMLAGCLAGISEHYTMLPFDNIKTHSQIKQYENMSYAQIIKIIYRQKDNGNFFQKLSVFWKGGSIVSLGCGPAHAAFFSIHELNKSYILQQKESLRPIFFAIGGGIACIFHDFIMTPFDVLKQRSQINHNMSNLDIFKDVIKKEGIQSFYRSFPVTLLMNIPWNGLMIMSNETLKPFISEDVDHSFFSYFGCAAFSSFIASSLTMPLDNIKTRLQTQGGEQINNQRQIFQSSVKYQNIQQTFNMIMKEEGTRGFFKGTMPKIVSTVPSSAISWSVYEIFKRTIIKTNLL